MNRLTKTAIATILATMSLAGVTYAEDTVSMNWTPELAQTLTTFSQPFNVEYIDDYNQGHDPDGKGTFDADDTNPFAVALPAPEVEKLQASIEANKPLTRRLTRRGVILDDIVNAQQAADGSVTFWLR